MELKTVERSSVLWAVGGWLGWTLAIRTVWEDATLSQAFVSPPLWIKSIRLVGGTPPSPDAPEYATVSLLVVAVLVLVAMAGMVGLLGWRCGSTNRALRIVGLTGVGPFVWLIKLFACMILNWASGYAVLVGSVDLVFAACLAIWLAACLAGSIDADGGLEKSASGEQWSNRAIGMVLAVMIAAYVIPFVWMNWGQYWSLRTPHGDTAMYEEHLWNLLHGKGFRSYLDQGLFLGEHIQVVHLLLIPIYVLYPSHLTIELCESIALASTAVPAYLLAAKASGSRQVGLWVAAAVLLYAPLHYLDIEIDRKSFRPIAFGVPAMLWAFYFVERRKWISFGVASLIALMAKEDYTLILGPLGLWIAWTNWRRVETATDRDSTAESSEERRTFVDTPWFGLLVTLVAGAYLFLTVKVVIPWFRGGETVHYARYFSQFGETPLGILWGMLTKPNLLFASLVTPATSLYVLRLFVPLGGTPLLAPSRLLVGMPVLGLLLLNQLSLDPPAPVHHFHAPLLPVLFWAMAVGVGEQFQRGLGGVFGGSARMTEWHRRVSPGRWSLVCLPMTAALCTGIALSYSPLSTDFWDPGRGKYWRTSYVPDQRAEEFAKVLDAIPIEARVASTDYVHPRFTHHERSYDYSGYVRKVAGYENRVPDDTDYIVLDVRGPYSEIRGRESVRELQAEPDRWDVLPIDTQGYFIVLKRREGT